MLLFCFVHIFLKRGGEAHSIHVLQLIVSDIGAGTDSRTEEVVRCENVLAEASNGDYSQVPLFLSHSFDEVSISNIKIGWNVRKPVYTNVHVDSWNRCHYRIGRHGLCNSRLNIYLVSLTTSNRDFIY